MKIELVFMFSSPKRKPFSLLKNMTCTFTCSTETIYAYCRYIYSDRKHCFKISYNPSVIKEKE